MTPVKALLHSVLVVLVAVFAPVGSIAATIAALCAVDLITGIIVSKKAGIAIQSSGIMKTVLKLTVYLIAVLCSFLVGQYLTGPLLPVLNIVAGLIGTTELKSILENLDGISGGSLMQVIVSAVQSSVSKNIPPSN